MMHRDRRWRAWESYLDTWAHRIEDDLPTTFPHLNWIAQHEPEIRGVLTRALILDWQPTQIRDALKATNWYNRQRPTE